MVFRGRSDLPARRARARHAAQELLRAPLFPRRECRSVERRVLARRAAETQARRSAGAAGVSGRHETRRECGEVENYLRTYAASLLWVRVASSSVRTPAGCDSRMRRSKSAAGKGRLK